MRMEARVSANEQQLNTTTADLARAAGLINTNDDGSQEICQESTITDCAFVYECVL